MSREPRHKTDPARDHLDPGDGGSEAPSAEKIEQLQAELQQTKDQYLRTLADVENTKKRLQREQDEFTKYAASAVVTQLLPIVDSLDRALLAADQQGDSEAMTKGIHLIHRQLLGLLEREGVHRIPAVGERFDSGRHEAVEQCEVQDGEADNTIVGEIQVGYTLHGQVLRPALVKVAKSQHEKKTDDTGTV